jgi:hypothetical protein
MKNIVQAYIANIVAANTAFGIIRAAGADGTAAFTDGEAQAFFHGDRGDQLDGDADVVARHDHFLVLGQLDAPVTSVVRK